MNIYIQLIISFFQIGLFTYGGGYAALPLIKYHCVDKMHWLTMTEFNDILTISQMTPGPIGINSATFTGFTVAGFGGAFCATFFNVLPSFIIVVLLAKIYYKYRSLDWMRGIMLGLNPAVVAMIASAGLSVVYTSVFNDTGAEYIIRGIKLISQSININLLSIILFIIGFIIIRKFKLGPVTMMIGTGFFGTVIHYALKLL